MKIKKKREKRGGGRKGHQHHIEGLLATHAVRDEGVTKMFRTLPQNQPFSHCTTPQAFAK